jgi:hypothetical protein
VAQKQDAAGAGQDTDTASTEPAEKKKSRSEVLHDRLGTRFSCCS